MRKIAVFGASKNGLRIKNELLAIGESVLFFCDNDPKKQGEKLDGIEIVSYTQTVQLVKKKCIDTIVISLIKPDEIVDQIRNSGVMVELFGVTRGYLINEGNCIGAISSFLYPIEYSKPRLEYFEYHVAFHCNLKCKGCGHYSNIAKPEFGNLNVYKNDIKRLKELYWGVERIRLMGGEPLLNKQLSQFIVATRNTFLDANIRVVTNGLLIPDINENLLKIMHEYNTGFDVTQYPPTQEVKEKIELRCLEHGVEMAMSPLVKEFFDNWNSNTENSQQISYERCISKGCHYLEDGKMSLCCAPILQLKLQDILKREVEVSENDIIDIYKDTLDGFLLNKYLSKPIKFCKYCDNENIKWFPWEGNYPYLN